MPLRTIKVQVLLTADEADELRTLYKAARDLMPTGRELHPLRDRSEARGFEWFKAMALRAGARRLAAAIDKDEAEQRERARIERFMVRHPGYR